MLVDKVNNKGVWSEVVLTKAAQADSSFFIPPFHEKFR